MLKRASIANLLAREDVSNGDVLRCLDTHRNIVLVGKVVDNGILVPGKTDKPVNLTQFEKIAAQSHSVECIVLPSGKTVEDCLGEINSERQKKRMDGSKSLIEDDHDDYCAYCGFGGNLLCCETCPVTTHAPCAGVCDSDSDKEWFCPGCRCALCQKALHKDNSPSVCPRVYYGEADCGREASSCHEYNDILNVPNRKRLRIRMETEDYDDKPEGTESCDEKVYLGTQLPDAFLKNFDVKENGVEQTDTMMMMPWDVVKSACGTWAHAACVKGFVKLANAGKAWYHGKEEHVLEKVVSFCSQGAIHVGKYACGATMSFQIIHPAAAASSEEAQGVVPKYSNQHKESLRRILSSCLYILRDSYDELWDSRTGTDLISMMLKGESKRPWVDFSDVFVAVLYVDSTVASVCCFRLLGESMAEIPLITSRQEIRGCKAGMALLSKLEQCLHVCGVQKVVMPAMYCPNHAYLPAFHPQGEPLPPPSQEKFGFAIAEANVVAKILSHRGVRLPGVPWVQKETNSSEWPEWREKCAKIRIKLADSIDLDTLLEKDHVHIIPSEDNTQEGQDVLPLRKKKQRMNCLDIVMKTEDELPDNVSLQTAQGNGDLKCVSCQ